MRLDLLWKGFAMGIAEAIPGVSGGTLAFITGIYEELLETIKKINPKNLKLLFTSTKQFFDSINGPFLLLLLTGMAIGLVSGVLVIGSLIETHREVLWAFFLGVVIMSIIHFSRIQKWSPTGIGLCIIMAALTFWVTTLNPASGSQNYLYIFIAGMVAVSALMLPGISGSFMLLLFGLYDTIIVTIKRTLTEMSFNSDTIILVVFGLGLVVGLFSFARVLSYLFKHYHQGTMAAMIGVLIGSINKLWPWKEITRVLNKTSLQYETYSGAYLEDPENYKIVSEQNLWPSTYAHFNDPRIAMVIGALVVGIIVVVFMTRYESKRAN